MTDTKLLGEEGSVLNPWLPDTDRQNLRVLGKALEELGEGVSAMARCIIQGIDECEPITGKCNRLWMTEEIADIAASTRKVVSHFNLDQEFIDARIVRKSNHLDAWELLIKEAFDLCLKVDKEELQAISALLHGHHHIRFNPEETWTAEKLMALRTRVDAELALLKAAAFCNDA